MREMLQDLEVWPGGKHVVDLQMRLEGSDARNFRICLRVSDALGIAPPEMAGLLSLYGLKRLVHVLSDVLADCMDDRLERLADITESSDPVNALAARLEEAESSDESYYG